MKSIIVPLIQEIDCNYMEINKFIYYIYSKKLNIKHLKKLSHNNINKTQ